MPPFELRLDWWLDAYGDGDKSELKVWAGQQTPERNLRALQDIWRKINAAQPERVGSRALFSQRWPETGMGFDPSSSWKAIDIGFSPDEQQINVLTSPAVEILAAIGLQRCRPERFGDRGRNFIYRAWAEPLEIVVAPAAIGGAGRTLSTHMFPVNMRNSQYGNFGWAKPWEDDR
jgi:CRISPR-associated protein Csx14